MTLIDDIRRLVVDEQYEITVHARERMAERGVSTEDLISLIISGEIIESYPDDFPYPFGVDAGPSFGSGLSRSRCERQASGKSGNGL